MYRIEQYKVFSWSLPDVRWVAIKGFDNIKTLAEAEKKKKEVAELYHIKDMDNLSIVYYED